MQCNNINCNDCNGCNAMNDNDHKIIISHYHSWRRWRSRKRHRSSAILCMRLWKSGYITRSSRKRLSLPAHLWSFLMTFLITWIQWVWNIVVQNKQSHHWLSMTCLALNYDLKGISQWQIRLQSDDKINNKSKNTQTWMLSIITIVQLAQYLLRRICISFIPIRRLTQDHVENLFSCVRSIKGDSIHTLLWRIS